MEKPSRAMNVHLGPALKSRWMAYCASRGTTPGAAIKQAIEAQLSKAGQEPDAQPRKQSRETVEPEPKERFEILLTASEKAAVRDRADLERCSMRRWIVDAIRTGLTGEPQFGMREIDALGESNYQLLSVGRNLNQIARRLNEGKLSPVAVERIEELRKVIDKHTDAVSNAIRASVERWNIE
ncbi:MobC family plasmid mobilization relaxosome protein [Rhizobium sp. TRM95111]|uniref:plasmid mobilization relaxosome protein MobC n=1 Tax=Rhizobium alarense TaxID=2846851 RepID=UPI001F2A49ED|nr:plasmid mobilization relaxosome protein MobC [Rhizobium alarense]MCF3643135.1 MobC family plasmid mobilization relaxosome protein [Rhizobium alarense]